MDLQQDLPGVHAIDFDHAGLHHRGDAALDALVQRLVCLLACSPAGSATLVLDVANALALRADQLVGLEVPTLTERERHVLVLERELLPLGGSSPELRIRVSERLEEVFSLSLGEID